MQIYTPHGVPVSIHLFREVISRSQVIHPQNAISERKDFVKSFLEPLGGYSHTPADKMPAIESQGCNPSFPFVKISTGNGMKVLLCRQVIDFDVRAHWGYAED